MAAAVQVIDDILKEYLLFRGFTSTLKAFDAELKADRDKSFRVRIFSLNCSRSVMIVLLLAFPTCFVSHFVLACTSRDSIT